MIIRHGWDAPHIRCFPRVFCVWPCLLRQVGTALGSPYDCVVTGITYANPGSRHGRRDDLAVVVLYASAASFTSHEARWLIDGQRYQATFFRFAPTASSFDRTERRLD